MISFEFDLKLRQIYYSFDTQSGSLHKELIITNIIHLHMYWRYR